MADNDKIKEETEQAQQKAVERVDLTQPLRYKSPLPAWLALIVAIGSWAYFILYGPGAIGFALIAIGLAALGIKARKRYVRNVAITAIIMALMLLVSIVAFRVVIAAVAGVE